MPTRYFHFLLHLHILFDPLPHGDVTDLTRYVDVASRFGNASRFVTDLPECKTKEQEIGAVKALYIDVLNDIIKHETCMLPRQENILSVDDIHLGIEALVIPENIRLIWQPLYSPQCNPVEN
ncbi:MAG: hypothetical protein JSU72_02275, partial [Deltaproteobacteria bacterium]